MRRANVETTLPECQYPELQRIQLAVAPQYRIRVVSTAHMMTTIFDGGDSGEYVNLLLHDNHFDVITSLAGFFATSYYCDYCKVSWLYCD
jgi:hypothetical protein